MELYLDYQPGDPIDMEFLKTYVGKEVPWGFGALSYVVYKRTYARYIDKLGRKEDWLETIARCVNGANRLGANYTVEEAKRLFDHIFNLRCSFSGRGLWQLGTQTIDLIGVDSLLNCFAGETPVLTRHGWKTIQSIAGQTVELVTSEGQWVKAPIRSFGKQHLLEVTYKVPETGKQYSVFSTPDHDWIVCNKKGCVRTHTKHLKPGDKLPVVLGKNSSDYLSPQGIQHGLVFGDGYSSEYDCHVDLIGDTLDSCSKWFSLNQSVPIKSNSSPRHIRYSGLPLSYKSLPSINESKAYLMGFLAGWLAADGSVRKNSGGMRLFNKDRDVLLAAKDIASVCGFRTGDPVLERSVNPFNGEDSELWALSFFVIDGAEKLIIREDQRENLNQNLQKRNQASVTVVSVVETDRYEEVFCASVEDTNSFVIENNILTGNCWVTKISTVDDFGFVFMESMLGGGVGCVISKEYTQELPRVKKGVRVRLRNTKDADYIVPDSKEGWRDLWVKILEAYLVTGKSFSYSMVCIRNAGEPIKTFGGIAPGPQPLIEGAEELCRILESRDGNKLRTQDVADIICVGGQVVKSGGVRRTALILLGDVDDIAYLQLKRWDKGGIPNYRSNSNNSLICNDFDELPEKFWDGYTVDKKTGFAKGEAYGLVNIEYAKKYGRLGETEIMGFNLHDGSIIGLNPCLPASSIVETADGPKRLGNLIGKQFDAVVNNKKHQSTDSGFFKTGFMPVYRVSTKQGYSVSCTLNHQILVVRDGKELWIEARNLCVGDQLVLSNDRGRSWGSNGTRNEGWLLGNMVSDGYVNDTTAKLSFWGDTRHYMQKYASDLLHQSISCRSDLGDCSLESEKLSIGSVALRDLSEKFGLTPEKNIGDEIELDSSSDLQSGFLSGWFDADGSVQVSQENGCSVRLCSVNLNNIYVAQRMLLRQGIVSTVYKNRRNAGEILLPDGRGGKKKYDCQATHELVIANDNIFEFANRIGFCDPEKQDKLDIILSSYKRTLNKENFLADYESLELVSEEDVFDATIPEISRFVANGIVVHNCAEATLADKESCNLAELFLNNLTSLEQMIDCATLLYKTQKAIAARNYLFAETNEIVHKNLRLGLGVTGVCQTLENVEEWTDATYRALREFDKSYSAENGLPQSIRLTVVKPSGTLSLLAGATPGVHPGYSTYHIRRVRLSTNDPLVDLLRRAGYHAELEVGFNGMENHDITIVEFPCSFNEAAVMASEMSAIRQLELVKSMQTKWADQAVSVTVYYKEEELPEIKSWLKENYDNGVKSVSFLLHSKHGFRQAPLEEIDRKTFDKMTSKVKPLSLFEDRSKEDQYKIHGQQECEGGACPLK